MDRVATRLDVARRTLTRLAEISAREAPSEIERDAAIQRFEFSFDAACHAARVFLQEREGIEVASPKAAIRAALQVGVLSEEDARVALVMADDRNLTAHAYNEALAARIFADLDGYTQLLERWIGAMERRAI